MKTPGNENSISLGIDMGAMNTVYSISGKKDNKFTTEVLLSDVAVRTFPSQICYSDTNRLYGETSNSKIKKFADTSYLDLSRLIGIFPSTHSLYNKEFEYLNPNCSKVENNKLLFKIYQNDFCDSSIIIADFLSLINKYLFEEQKIKYDNVTFSVYDYFTEYQRNKLKQIAKGIGMKNIKIINNSTALTLYYGYNKYNDLFGFKNLETPNICKHVIFVDCGHSKTSFIYSSFTPSTFKVEKVYTIYIGGRNFDKRIKKLCIDTFAKEHNLNLNDRDIKNYLNSHNKQLLDAIQKARKVLTVNKDTDILIEGFYKEEDLIIPMTRENFEAQIQDYINEIQKQFQNFIKDISEEIKKDIIIEMAGDLMRIPKLQIVIKNCFQNKKEISKTIIIDECYSIGASLYGYYKQNNFFYHKNFKNIIPYNSYQIICSIINNTTMFFQNIYQNYSNINCNSATIDLKDPNIKDTIFVQFYYNENLNYLIPSYYNSIYTFKIDLNQLKNEQNKIFNKCSDLIIQFLNNEDEINLKLFLGTNDGFMQECKNSKAIELLNNGIINNQSLNYYHHISQKKLEHENYDNLYHKYVYIKNGLIKFIQKIKNKYQNQEELNKYNSKIKKLSNIQQNLNEKIKIIEKIKGEIETNYAIQLKNEEIEFEGQKEKFIKKLMKIKNKFKEEMKEEDNILRQSVAFFFRQNLKLNNENEEKDNINQISVIKSFEKKNSNLSNTSEEGFEKLFEFNEEDAAFFDELINEIILITVKDKNKFLDIKNNWKDKIYNKKNESKKNHAIKQIDNLLSLNYSLYKPLEKTKIELEKGTITSEKALEKIFAFENLNK